jgi:hypothetical protein
VREPAGEGAGREADDRDDRHEKSIHGDRMTPGSDIPPT